jgi:hypothetical protein
MRGASVKLVWKATSRRAMGGGGGRPGETYEGVYIPRPERWQEMLGEVTAGLMWFWILYRFKHDYRAFFVRSLHGCLGARQQWALYAHTRAYSFCKHVRERKGW